MRQKTKIKSLKKNKYFESHSFDDIKVVDDSKYILKGSEKQYVHLCTVEFIKDTYVMFCEAEKLVEHLNRERLGDNNYGFLRDEKLLQPNLYIEKVRYFPRGNDSITSYLERIVDDDLFYFLLEYFKFIGVVNEFQIKSGTKK